MSHHHHSSHQNSQNNRQNNRNNNNNNSSGASLNLGSLLGNLNLTSLLQNIDIGKAISLFSQLNSLKSAAQPGTSLFQNSNNGFLQNNTKPTISRNNTPESAIPANNTKALNSSISQEQITSILSKFNVNQESVDRIIEVLSNINLPSAENTNTKNAISENAAEDDIIENVIVSKPLSGE